MSVDAFLEQHARTRGFSLGVPHSFVIREEPAQVLFLRSAGPDDAHTGLWVADLASGEERLVIDAGFVAAEGHANRPTGQQRRHQERGGVKAWSRVTAEGIAEYSTDADAHRVCFASADALWLVDVDERRPEKLTDGACVDPRFDPSGAVIAFVEGNDLNVVAVEDRAVRTVAKGETDVTWGLPEYVASDMKRFRGYWWAPDGRSLAVARVDNRDVTHWYLGNPAEPSEPPTIVARPTAGDRNADVTLWIIGLDGGRIAVEWDRVDFEYLAGCSWTSGGLVIAVQSRDQRTLQILDVDPTDGRATLRRALTDPCWVTTFKELPIVLPDGRLLWARTLGDTHTLCLEETAITPPGLQLLEVVSSTPRVVFTATSESTETHLWAYDDTSGLTQLSSRPGVNTGVCSTSTVLVTHHGMDESGPTTVVSRDGLHATEIASLAETPGINLRARFCETGPDAVRTVVLAPEWWDEGHGPLPVLMDPYGGLGLRKVERARSTALLVSQWFANQGFAVIVADGHGTPGRGSAWERSVHNDIETLPVADQITALHEIAERHPGMIDTNRVGIRGWSWGGFLSALCVLRRPDVFHAAVVGAAVADHWLYQSYWKERQLGNPHEEGERYERFSLPANAALLERPLLLVHGSNDDNVFAAHALRFAWALTEACRPHELLLVAGYGHHAIRLPVSRYLLRYQLDFLRRALGISSQPGTKEESS